MDFLGRARKAMKVLGPQEAAKPQYYRVACPEGHVLRGLRTEGYQALRCPTCGEGIFVLPRSPLPEPPIPHIEQPKPRQAPLAPAVADGPITLSDPPPGASASVEAEIEWDEPEPGAEAEVEVDPEEPARPAATRAETRPKPNAAATPARPKPAAARPARRPAPALEVEFEPGPPRERLGERLRRHRHALIVVGVLLLVAGTFGIRMLRQRRQNLPQIAEASRTAGFDALESGEFDVAKKKLAEAAGALEDLGDDDAAAVRQTADEAAVLADLASASLEEIVEEVATRSDGNTRFASLHKGRSVLIDARVDSRAGGVPEIDYRIFVGSGPLAKAGRLDLEGFELLEGRKPGDRVTFGARLASVSLEDDRLWHVRFEPKSGVYVRSPQAWKALATLGWEPIPTESEAAP